ncbi:MAG: hypothetical protein U9Q07_04795, partial [Planctomycetota bacterium]|nr:hypothetical protein [Planctomycetota bacterium]
MSEEVKVELSLKDKASPALLKFQRTAVSAAKRIKSAFGGMIKAAFSLKGALLAVGGAAVARSFIEAGNKMEKFRQQLTGLANGVKSVAEANLTWLRKFGATTTHTTADVIQSFVQLKAVGIDANKEMMTAVGDAAYMFDKNITDVAQGLIGLETD